MEPPSLLISWVNPFPNRFINRTIFFCNALAAGCHFSIFIGILFYQRAKPPKGILLFINLLGKGLTPRACMGDAGSIWWVPAYTYIYTYTWPLPHGAFQGQCSSTGSADWMWRRPWQPQMVMNDPGAQQPRQMFFTQRDRPNECEGAPGSRKRSWMIPEHSNQLRCFWLG